jgi:hypothetical protein
MEQRAGHRLAIVENVRIQVGTESEPVDAVLLDMSISGAFVHSPSRASESSAVQLQWIQNEADASSQSMVAARVVRQSPDGFGIEWADFAPREVCMRLNRRWLRETLEQMPESIGSLR